MDTEKALQAIHKVLKDQRKVLVQIRDLLALPDEGDGDDQDDKERRPRLAAAPDEPGGRKKRGA